MDFRITSIETIKPSSPTPHHLRTHKLSLIDQLNPGAYFSVILFYSGGQLDTIDKTSDHLKKSLSKTLTHFYPLAGQFKDNLFVDCNDHGVTFIEAHFAGDISEVIKQADIKILEQIVPCRPHEATRVDQNLMVKVNYFGCGGIAIGICFHHKLADGATTASFIKSWGMIARAKDDDGDDFKCVVYDSNSMFPAQDDLPNMALNIGLGLFSLDSVVKRFTFDGSKIKSIREKIVNENNIESFLDRPTRVEIVSSVILGALLAEAYTNVTAIIAVNLRKRMNPQLSEDSFGNITSAATLNLPTDQETKKVMNYGSLAKEIHRSIKMVDDQSVRKLYGEGEVLKLLNGDHAAAAAAAAGQGIIGKVFVISSWCKMPFNEADFGWGKAMSVGLGTRFIDAAVLVDSCDGEGIEAWVGLSKQDMARFEQHPGILAYTSY